MRVGRGLAHEQDVVAPLRNLVGEMSEQAQEEGIGNQLLALVTERDRDGNRLRLALAQVPRGAIYDIAMLSRQRLDRVTRRLGNGGMIGKRPRHGRRGYPRDPRNVRHLDCPA